MSHNEKLAITVGVVLGLAIAFGAAFWQLRTAGPDEQTVRRVVVTTIEKETPASYLITGTLQISAEATVDSASTITPQWFNEMVQVANPALGVSIASFASVSDRVTVKVPGRVSYGFDVRDLNPSMIAVDGNLVSVDLPALSVRAIEPDLRRMEVRTAQTGSWKRMFATDPAAVQDEVKSQAFDRVQQAFREQAEARLQTATQPRLNTARALRTMLKPSLLAVGISNPEFRIRIGDDLVLEPGDEGRSYRGR